MMTIADDDNPKFKQKNPNKTMKGIGNIIPSLFELDTLSVDRDKKKKLSNNHFFFLLPKKN